ncbi:MAG: pyruvate, water dikinase regulatory protein [Planctomycetota bacterium]|jgi:regulator of PEP synthase PpsR (kinase-PPPase family)
MDCPEFFIVSDGRGETATRLVKSALVQFEGREHRFQTFAGVRTAKRVREIVEDAAACQATVFYTLVASQTRDAIQEHATRLLVPAVDVLGPTLSALFDLFKSEPASKPGLLYDSDRAYFDRMVAIDFTIKHDDGQNPQTLNEADVVLVGVSRASKSSTSFFLGYSGIRTANVPLIPGIKPPSELLKLDRRVVIGLAINARRLKTVREVRARSLGGQAVRGYLDDDEIVREIRHANELMAKRRWRSVDVSYKAIEEIAKEVAELRGIRLRIPE